MESLDLHQIPSSRLLHVVTLTWKEQQLNTIQQRQTVRQQLNMPWLKTNVMHYCKSIKYVCII